MDQLIPLEIWAVIVAAPCMIAWYLGELRGAARMRRMIEARDLIDPVDPVRTSPAKGKIPSRAARPIPTDAESTESDAAVRADSKAHAPMGKSQSDRDDLTVRKRSDAFKDMPSLEELHSQAQRIREAGKVWEDDELGVDPSSADPVSARILQHYRGSINELGRRNALAVSPVDRPVDGVEA